MLIRILRPLLLLFLFIVQAHAGTKNLGGPANMSVSMPPPAGMSLQALLNLQTSLQIATEQRHANPLAIQAAFLRFSALHAQIANRRYIAVVDFTLPSHLKRLFVFNTHTGSMQSFFVAHGLNSGELWTEQVSNEANSYKSSSGAFLTGSSYSGVYGTSLELRGLDPTNSNTDARDIVMHGAPYVSDDRGSNGMGRTLGCFGISMQASTHLIRSLQGGSLLYVYWNETALRENMAAFRHR